VVDIKLPDKSRYMVPDSLMVFLLGVGSCGN
jgi:hypothetical protein